MSSLFERGLGDDGLIQRLWAAAGADTGDGVTQTVTLGVRQADGTYFNVTGITAIRRVIDRRDSRVQMGLVTAGTTVFHLRESTMGNNVARQHDQITDQGGTVYHIDFARLETNDSRWRCEVVQNV